MAFLIASDLFEFLAQDGCEYLKGGNLVVEITELNESTCCCESKRRTSAALMLVWLSMHMDVMHLVQDDQEMIQQELIPDIFGICSLPMLYTDDEQQEAIDMTISTLDKSDESTPFDDSVYNRKLTWMKHLT